MMHGSWDVEHNGHNFLSFWNAFCPFTSVWTQKIMYGHVYHKWESYYVWLLRYGAWWTEFFVILDSFFPFTQTTWKIKPLKKMKKTPRDIIILHMCTINNNHIMYGSWDMKCDGYRFLSCWAIFCSLALLTTKKTKILKKGKKPWKCYHFTHDHMIICCAVPEIQCMRNETFIFYFELFSVCPPPVIPKNLKN